MDQGFFDKFTACLSINELGAGSTATEPTRPANPAKGRAVDKPRQFSRIFQENAGLHKATEEVKEMRQGKAQAKRCWTTAKIKSALAEVFPKRTTYRVETKQTELPRCSFGGKVDKRLTIYCRPTWPRTVSKVWSRR